MQPQNLPPVIRKTDLGVGDRRQGKVRDIYDLGDHLLLVVTDRLSAFDVVLPGGIPGKGIALTQISNWWFDRMGSVIPNHVAETDATKFPDPLDEKEEIRGRSVLVDKAEPLPIECIVRGYIVGSGWKDYQKTGKISGHDLPEGLSVAQKLPDPIFTPSTKAKEGHDVNITEQEAEELVGSDVYEQVKEASLQVYSRAADEARGKGIIIADTKFEFGIRDDEVILIDELLTPDSSRFWPEDEYTIGKNPPSFDKQYVRDYLETLDWDKTPPGPDLPDKVVDGTTKRYLEAYKRLTDEDLAW